MPYVARALEGTIRRAMRTFPAVLVTGARQTGKTTLLRERFGATHRYVSLERPDVRRRALDDPVAFLREAAGPVILDEIQYAPELLHYVKELIDEDRRAGAWLLTGSQYFPVMRGISQTLAGRVAVLTLDPLSVGEAMGWGGRTGVDARISTVFGGRAVRPPGAPPDLGDWLLRGAFPEPRLRPEVDRRLWCASYVQTYLERDVRDLLQVGDLDAFGRFLGLVAARTGSLLNMTDLGRDVGVAGPTVRRWLSVLEATQLVYLLRPYHRNFGKRLVKSPKCYLLDLGLATYLLGLHTPEAIVRGPSAGALFETAVVAEWVKAFRQAGEQPALFFWRASGGDEVDLVIERDGRLHGLEIKATATPTPRHAEGLARWMALAGPETRGAVACAVREAGPLSRGVRAVPWWSGG